MRARPTHGPYALPDPWPLDVTLPMAAVRRAHFLAVLAHHKGNRTRAARALGVDTKSVYLWLRQAEAEMAREGKSLYGKPAAESGC